MKACHFTLFAFICAAARVPAASFTVGGYTWDSDNAVTSAAFTEGGPGFFGTTSFSEDTRSIGKLLGYPNAGAVFVDITNTVTNTARATVTMDWSAAPNGALLANGAGDDFVVYETGSAGAPEAYAVSLRNAQTQVYTPYHFFQASSFDAAAAAFATAFDISDFGAGINQIDRVAIRTIFNSAGPNGGDRVDLLGGSGQGEVTFDVGAGNFTNRLLEAGPQGSAGEFAASRLDADIVYVVGLHNTVPEPSAALLAGAAVLGLLLRRRV
ncbi:MAG: PEP-CTERM sorting domain-containing protein [Verrucomicrobiales bacterium]|nr:PEP-CTERM sorting domain-containing protein [Verrucomicrobiales bacterium]